MVSKIKFLYKINNLEPIDKWSKLKNNNLIFKKISMQYLKEFHNYSIDPRLYEFLGYEPFTTIKETRSYLNKLLNRISNKENNAIYWFIFKKKSKKLVGTAGLLNISYENNSAEIGFGIDPKLWGKGYIITILEIIKFYSFEVLELNRIYGSTFKKNLRTINSIKASGMISEGIKKQVIKKNDKFHDTWSYRMLKSEYIKSRRINKNDKVKIKNNEVVKIVSTVLRDNKINLKSNIDNTFSWDSLSHLNIFLELSKFYKIDFLPKDIGNSTSIMKIITNLSKYIK